MKYADNEAEISLEYHMDPHPCNKKKQVVNEFNHVNLTVGLNGNMILSFCYVAMVSCTNRVTISHFPLVV